MFSPGNLRATFDNPNYERLISHYIGEKYTLRYTGGMVPDVFQIIVKEKGVFTNVISPSTKAKLRILFEVAPLSLLVRSCVQLIVLPVILRPGLCARSLSRSRKYAERTPSAARANSFMSARRTCISGLEKCRPACPALRTLAAACMWKRETAEFATATACV